jgi:hypothetical protein
MERLASELAGKQTEAAGRLSDAVQRARQLAIGAKMHQSARDLGENRVGQALSLESQIPKDLQQVLDILRGQLPKIPEQLVDELRGAEQRLAALRRQLGALRRQIAQAEKQPAGASTAQLLAELHAQQQRLRTDIEQLARQLERLHADEAEQSARRAAGRLEDQQAASSPRPSASGQVQQAEKDLETAARQLGEHRRQAEDDLSLEFVRRFQRQLGEMVQRQQRIIDRTLEAERRRAAAGTRAIEVPEAAASLARQERELAEKAREHSELLVGLGAVRVGLEQAERRLNAAAELLEANDTGPATQRAERQALARLEGMLQAIAQTAGEAAANQQSSAAGAAGEQPPRRPTFELLELKMLRLLQADLNERTAAHEQRLAGLSRRPDAREQLALTQEAQELAADQGRLAELVQNMLTRDNDP